MYPEALDYLSCPAHPHTRLLLEPNAVRDDRGAIVSGKLRCPLCNALFAIDEGVADLLGPWALPNSPAQAVNYLPPTAWAYERTWRPRALTMLSGEPFGYDRELPLITRLVEPERGGLLLDIACSNGLYARAIARARARVPGHVVGIDHALPMLRQARAYARRDGLRISFVRARAQALPFAAGSVAGATMGGSLNEIGDVDGCLREIRRVLAPDGRYVLMSLSRAGSLTGRALQQFLGLGGIAFWTVDELNRRLQAHGLDLKAQWRYRLVVFSLLTPRPAPQPAPPS